MPIPDSFEPVLAVNWQKIENVPPKSVQRAVEYYGTAHAGKRDPEAVPDSWQPTGKNWTQLHQMLQDHASFNVPGRGPLSNTYLGLTNATGLEEVLRAYRGDDDANNRFPVLAPIDPATVKGSTTPAAVPDAGLDIDEEDLATTTSPKDHRYSLNNTDFGEELEALVEAAKSLETRVSTFNDPEPEEDSITGRPRIKRGQYGPDELGSLYIACFVPEEIAADGLPIEDLPVGIEELWEDVPQPGIDVTLRHERYTDIPWASEPWGERTHSVFGRIKQNADFSGGTVLAHVPRNISETIEEKFRAEQTERTVEMPEDSVCSLWALYRVNANATEKEEPVRGDKILEANTEWVAAPVGSELDSNRGLPVLAFAAFPTREDIRDALTVNLAQGIFREGHGEAVYACDGCGEWTHWLGAETDPNRHTILHRLEYAQERICGCAESDQNDNHAAIR